MLDNIRFGRRKFLKVASAAGIIGMGSTASAAAAESEQEEYPITVHAFDGGRWEYNITHAGNLEKGAAANGNDSIEMSISGDAVSGTIYSGYYDNYTSSAYVSRLEISNEQDERLVIEHDLDGNPYDMYVEAEEGDWTYYLSAREPITKAAKAEPSDTEYGTSVSGYVSAWGDQTKDTYNYTQPIEFIQVDDGLFFDLSFGN